MPRFLITWLLTAIAFMITAYIVPGFEVSGLVAGAIAAVILGLVNAVVRPLLVILTLPLTILTLGLFLLVVNALSLLIASALTPGLNINGLVPAILGSIVLTLVTSVLNQLVGTDEA
ncbi:phage holin family protein [Geitlerinema sp. PCC 7407]|uniref:phage holin family protein n=1 Tax=Geitlerinema sp. PCC 7407 TaxID=1173025 RepID=UPI00029FB3AD|nr:phage holin family protein [Geitlerinema sp. PCC 7407]AFY65697.1 membrane protein of unknown function [Geitlerinema sp. PCC 7407]